MGAMSLEEALARPAHSRLLRFLVASPQGLDAALLASDEQAAARDLLEGGFAYSRDSRLILAEDTTAAPGLRERLMRPETADVDQLRQENRELAGTLVLIQELFGILGRCHNVADLVRAGFQRLVHSVPFDVGITLMIEQNLDIYVSRTVGRDDLVNDGLISRLRETLQSQIPISFASTDVVVKGDFSDLPKGQGDADLLRQQTQTLLKLDNRIAGIVVLFRESGPFSDEEQRLLQIFTNQLATILGVIQAREQIQNLADSDDLTGIWNKRYFRRQLPTEVERSRIYNIPLSLLMLDLDDFKTINDSYGHVMGDVVLSELCGTIRETLRPPDLFARFGGDEFSIILPHTDLWGARSVSERILHRVRELNVLTSDDGRRLPCTISMGIATLLSNDMTANELIERADERLYTAKKEGKNRYAW